MSLGIRPLHELFDMYRAHEATEVHDKIFALLGMCSDSSDVLSAGFSLDYTVTWEELASQLTKLWLGPSVTTKVLNDGRKLELEAEGFVLGTLVGVRSDFKTGGQRAEIITPGISNQRLLPGTVSRACYACQEWGYCVSAIRGPQANRPSTIP